jgi:hypothetical protein
LQKGDK